MREYGYFTSSPKSLALYIVMSWALSFGIKNPTSCVVLVFGCLFFFFLEYILGPFNIFRHLDDIIDVWNGFNHLLAYTVHLLYIYSTFKHNGFSFFFSSFLSFFSPALKFAKNRILMLNWKKIGKWKDTEITGDKNVFWPDAISRDT